MNSLPDYNSLPDCDSKVRALMQGIKMLEEQRAYYHAKLKNNPDYIAYKDVLEAKKKAMIELIEYYKSQQYNMF